MWYKILRYWLYSVNSKQEQPGISFQLALFSSCINYPIKVVGGKSPAPSLLWQNVPWVQEVFFLCAAEILSGNAGPYKDLTETGNRTRKVSGTQGRQTVINVLQETCKELKDGTRRFLNRVKSCDNTTIWLWLWKFELFGKSRNHKIIKNVLFSKRSLLVEIGSEIIWRQGLFFEGSKWRHQSRTLLTSHYQFWLTGWFLARRHFSSCSFHFI